MTQPRGPRLFTECVKREPVTREVVVAAAIIDGDRLLAARRTVPADLAGRWELPGGKVEAGESDEDALVREIREELGVELTLVTRVGGDWPLARGVLRVWLAKVKGTAGPQPIEQHDELRWLAEAEIDDVQWLPADRDPAAAAVRQWRELPRKA
jgi:8-oxo-dGTP diphosphatase